MRTNTAERLGATLGLATGGVLALAVGIAGGGVLLAAVGLVAVLAGGFSVLVD